MLFTLSLSLYVLHLTFVQDKKSQTFNTLYMYSLMVQTYQTKRPKDDYVDDDDDDYTSRWETM